MKHGLVVFGCGGHGKVVADAARLAGFDLLGFADDAVDLRGRTFAGLPVVAIGLDETAVFCTSNVSQVVIAVGTNAHRRRLYVEASARSLRVATVIHPRAAIAASATVGAGTVAFAGVVVNADAAIGEAVILNTGACVDHDNVVGPHAHLSPGVALGGAVSVGEGAHLGVGVSVRNNVSIGAWTMVGVGAAVVSDLPDDVTAVGVPARVVGRSRLRPPSG